MMLPLTNAILVFSCLSILASCNAEGSGWIPLLTEVAQRRYGLSGDNHNTVSTTSSANGYQLSNGQRAYETTAKYQYGDNMDKQNVPFLNDGFNVNTYKSALSHVTVDTNNRQNHPGMVNNKQHLNYASNPTINTYNSAPVINNNNHHGNNMQYGSNGPGNVINNLGMHKATNYSGRIGNDAFSITIYRGTLGNGERKGGELANSVISNYASRRPTSYDQAIHNKIFDQNKNPHYNVNFRSNSHSSANADITHDQNNNHQSNNNNNNLNDNTGTVKNTGYRNNDAINYGHANINGYNSVVTEYTTGGNTVPTSQNNNYNWNDINNNNNNNGYRQGSPNDNLNVHPAGDFNKGVKSSYTVDDNYVEGPPPRQPHAPQLYQHQSMLPAVNPQISSFKSQRPPSLQQQYNYPLPDLKPFQPNSRPPMASNSYSPSPRPQLQGTPLSFITQAPQQLPMKLTQPQPPRQQQEIAPHQQVMTHPAPNHPPHQTQPETENPNQVNLQGLNVISDSFFRHLMTVIANTIFYGDLESIRPAVKL